MNKFVFTSMLISLFSINLDSQDFLSDFDELRWENRIIVILTSNDTISENVQKELTLQKTGIKDRDLVYFIITPDQTITNSSLNLSPEFKSKLLEDFFEKSGDLKVTLIGKDGGIKMEKTRFILQDIFDRIDIMPMRIQEMKTR